MARPAVPLISKARVCELALQMIDEEGIEVVTIRKIAAKIGVNGASLYHHFRNKEEILAGAAELALAEAHTSRVGSEGWKTWCLRNAERLYLVLRKHPNLIPILVSRNSLKLAFEDLEFYFGEFERQGLDISVMWMLMESLQAFTIGTIMHVDAPPEEIPNAEQYPNIRRATESRRFSRDQEFRIGCRAIVEAVERSSPKAPPSLLAEGV